MKRYRLKDRAMQEALDKMTDGGFSDALQGTMEKGEPDGVFYEVPLFFDGDEIEAYGEYNPNKWNIYPDVTPPEGVLMACESDDGDTYHFSAYFLDGKWYDECGVLVNPVMVNVDRFRPWPEDEENEK